MKPNIFTVSQVNGYIKSMLEEDVLLCDIFIEAEISNYKRHSTGHLYFTLKDEKAAMNVVMFRSAALALAFEPQNGLKVIAYGRVSVYEKTGQYQLYVEFLEPAGKGALQFAFEQTVQRLAKDGIFDVAHKKEIPRFPRTVVLITAPTGAVVQDMIRLIRQRNDGVRIVVIPALVQGDRAVDSIVSAIALANEWGQGDVIILGRGGGSMEDLWCFNEEEVARAVYASAVPIVSAIGHETDTTITDYAADIRMPTPSAAAEIVPSKLTLRAMLRQHYGALLQNCEMQLQRKRAQLQFLSAQPVLRKPGFLFTSRRAVLERLVQDLHKGMALQLREGQKHLLQQTETLELMSPLATLRRGYALVYDDAGVLCKSAENAAQHQNLCIHFYDGCVEVCKNEQGSHHA